MRDSNPANDQNWKLVCSACGAEFLNDEVINLVAGHFQEEHPDLDKPNFNLVWAGVGPAPRGGRQRHPHRGRRR